MENRKLKDIHYLLDYNLSIKERIDNLISQMTLEEKVSQIFNMSAKIERLNIPKYDWRNECIHGVAFASIATVFPQSIGLAATWNPELIYKVASAISDEARAKYHKAIRINKRTRYYGLTFAAPNVNIFRDPRWGRGQETYGEDPYLTSRMGVAFIKGLQGNNSKYLKLIAEPKHFAVHSGPERERHQINVKVNKKDLWETYLPAFKACIQEGKAFGIMGAYNRLNNEPCCASKILLEDILRKQFGFKGYIISDGGAITDIYKNHKATDTIEEAYALSLNAGCDLINPLNVITKWKIKKHYNIVFQAVKKGLISENTINKSIIRLYTARFKLGMFEPLNTVPYTQIPYEIVDCKKHRNLALQSARESIVLLKNEDNILPLSRELGSIGVIGPNVNNIDALLGDYFGEPSKYVTPLQGLENKILSKIKIYFAKGCDLINLSKEGFSEAIKIAEKSDIIIMFMGLSNHIEGEEGYVLGSKKGDRFDLNLPFIQQELIKSISNIGKPIILILLSGSALSINFSKKYIPGIIQAWYPGEEGGTAIADVIFGDYNPAGRLPITYYKSIEQLPDFKDYSMKNRTYRFMKEKPLFPFGYGLSYTKFKYSNLRITPKKVKTNENVYISVDIQNIGNFPGDEVVQLYISKKFSSYHIPIRELKGFKRIHLKLGQIQTVSFTLSSTQYCLINNDGKSIFEQGEFIVSVGGNQPRFNEDHNILHGSFQVLTSNY